jgi:hypothetical protein
MLRWQRLRRRSESKKRIMNSNLNPCLYQINTRVWLNRLSRQIGRPATLDDIPDVELDELANSGFDWVYFLSVWQTGQAARQVSRSNPQWLAEYREILPDLQEEAICGSEFAITSYTLNTRLGKGLALIRLRDRLHQRGLKLMLDFVPNHTAPDHPWIREHPEYYVTGTEALLAEQPQNYYTYDKRLYDRLREQQAHPVREHFRADLDYQRKSARFLENHDEPRAAATFPPGVHEAAAVLTCFCPGLRFFHQGQLQGWNRKISVHLCRGPQQPSDPGLQEFYRQLLDALRLSVFRIGDWQLLECKPAWEGNWTGDCFIAFAWQGVDGQRAIAVVNYAPNQSQCYLTLPWPNLHGQMYRLNNLMATDSYSRSGDGLLSPGLCLDLPAWGYGVFELIREG